MQSATVRTIGFIAVGSSDDATQLGEELYLDRLAQYAHALARCLIAHGGTRVKPESRSYVLSFNDPTNALKCAVAMRSEAKRLGLQTEIGLHTGECDFDGDQPTGLTVHVAERIMKEAGPGRLIVSKAMKDACSCVEFEFEDMGARTLRRADGLWHLFELL